MNQNNNEIHNKSKKRKRLISLIGLFIAIFVFAIIVIYKSDNKILTTILFSLLNIQLMYTIIKRVKSKAIKLDKIFKFVKGEPLTGKYNHDDIVVAYENKILCNIILKDAGYQRLKVIKVVRDATGMGLKEANDLVDGAPKTVKENVAIENAEKLKSKLESVGATIELQLL